MNCFQSLARGFVSFTMFAGSTALIAQPLTKIQMLEDFDQLTSIFRAYYFPKDYKENVQQIEVEDEIQQLRSVIEDEEVPKFSFGQIMRKFASIFKDAHVSPRIYDQVYYSIPMTFEFVGGAFVVKYVYDNALRQQGIHPGMILKTLDGKNPKELVQEFEEYYNVGKALPNTKLIAHYLTFRRFNLPDDKSSYFELVDPFPNKQGEQNTIHTYDLYWKRESRMPYLNRVPGQSAAMHQVMDSESLQAAEATMFQAASMDLLSEAGLKEFAKAKHEALDANPEISDEDLEKLIGEDPMRAYRPFFENTLVEEFGALEVKADKRRCVIDPEKKLGLPHEPLEIPAYVFQHHGKNLGVVRLPTFSPSHRGLNAFQTMVYFAESYKCLLKKLEKSTDGLIIDQTDNGGGYLHYMNLMSQMFLSGSGKGTANYIPTDRKWQRQFAQMAEIYESIEPDSYHANYYRTIYEDLVEGAENGKKMIGPISIAGPFKTLAEDQSFTFKKPVMVAIDSLDASSADAFPKVMQMNGHKLFGEETMGAGGNVELTDPLTHSQYYMSITRSLFFGDKQSNEDVPHDEMIENNGVKPDYPYELKIQDLYGKNPYAMYIRAMADSAVHHVKSTMVQ